MAKSKQNPVDIFKERNEPTHAEQAMANAERAGSSIARKMDKKEAAAQPAPSVVQSEKQQPEKQQLTKAKDGLLDRYGIAKKKELRDKHISVFLTQRTYQRLKSASQEAGASVNSIINGLIEDFLDNFESVEG